MLIGCACQGGILSLSQSIFVKRWSLPPQNTYLQGQVSTAVTLANTPDIDPEILEIVSGAPYDSAVPIALVFINLTYLTGAVQPLQDLLPATSLRLFTYTPRITLSIAPITLREIWNQVRSLLGLEGIYFERETELTWLDASRQLNINPTLWNLGWKGDPESSVAVIDHGFDTSQACFAGKNITWVDFADTNWAKANDTVGHGTRVASIAVGNGWNYTDDQGRTIMTQVYGHKFTNSLNITPLYQFIEFSVNVSMPGALNLTGYWKGSDISMKNFSFFTPNGSLVASVETPNANQRYTLAYDVPANELGVYTVSTRFFINSHSGDYTLYNISLELRIPQLIEPGGYSFQGVAPDCKLVALRALYPSEVAESLSWIKANCRAYNITSVVMSFDFNKTVEPDILRTCNDLVSNGIVVVAAAGNKGAGSNYAGGGDMPAAADKALSVGAITYANRVTSYSSQGGSSYPIYYSGSKVNGYTTKPDVLAPGGESSFIGTNNRPLILPDANTVEGAETEKVINDTSADMGTSFATPAVAGLAQLLVQALGGMKNWNFTESQALALKSVICMTATETYQSRVGSTRNESVPSDYNPTLDRGEKDVQEGYGRINPLAAIQAVTTTINLSQPNPTGCLWGQSSGSVNATRCWASQIILNRSCTYNFTLTNPNDGDFDLYLYDSLPTTTGDPVICRRSINAGNGGEEVIRDAAVTRSGYYYIVIKAVSGNGTWTLSTQEIADLIPPSLCLLGDLPAGNYLAQVVILTVSASDGQTGIQRQELWAGTPGIGQLLATQDGNDSIRWDTSKVQDQVCIIKARVFDGNNNSLDSSNFLNAVIDNTPPDLAKFSNLRAYGKYGGAIQIEVDVGDALSGVSDVTIGTLQRGVLASTAVPGDGSYRFVWQTTQADDYLYNIYIIAKDRAGNQYQSGIFPIFVANLEITVKGMTMLPVFAIPAFIIGFYVTRKLFFHDVPTRVVAFFEKFRQAMQSHNWKRVKVQLREIIPRPLKRK